MAEDDCRLMLRYAGGDLRAFAALYARHRAALYRYLARNVRERSAADDLFQEVWTRVVAHRAAYEARAKFSTFLYRIARNCCIDYLRRAAARPQQALDEEPGATRRQEQEEGWRDGSWQQGPYTPDSELPDALAERAELLARYRMALERLPPEQRDVFLLYEQSGLSLEEIAAITGVGAETVKSRLRYALAKLRCELSPSPPSAPSLTPRLTAHKAATPAPGAAQAVRDRQGSVDMLPVAQIMGEPGS